MGSYYIPSNNLKGESRILYIFTPKSLIYTAMGLSILGFIFIGLFALMGYGVATIKMPTSGNSKLAKNVGGDSIDDIVLRYIVFKKNKKIYTYAIDRKEPDYTSVMDKLSVDNIMHKVTGQTITKEEK